MKRTIILSLTALLAFAFQAEAQETQQKRQRTIKADPNKDGVIDKNEYDLRLTKKITAQKMRADKIFAKADANNDNVLSKNELQRMRKMRRANINRKQGRMAHNRKAPMTQKRNMQARKMFQRMDTNDKQIDRKEFKAMKKRTGKRMNARRAFNRIDLDRNDLLSPQELRKARAKRIAHKTK